MADRKVLNKYYPPDFDPSKLPRTKKAKNKQVQVRIMLPMSIQCARCGEFIYKGKKFNAFKEEAVGEAYLLIKVWRFYFKCPYCTNEITFKTDPKNSNYTVEHGATRNYEPWRAAKQEEDEAKAKRAHEDEDAMKRLENKAIESKREMAIADAIEELRERNSKGNQLTFAQVVDAVVTSKVREEEEEIALEARLAFARANGGGGGGGGRDGGEDDVTSLWRAHDSLLDVLAMEEVEDQPSTKRRRGSDGGSDGGNHDDDDNDDDAGDDDDGGGGDSNDRGLRGNRNAIGNGSARTHDSTIDAAHDALDEDELDEDARLRRRLLASTGISFAALKQRDAEQASAAAPTATTTTTTTTTAASVASFSTTVLIKKRKPEQSDADASKKEHAKKKTKTKTSANSNNNSNSNLDDRVTSHSSTSQPAQPVQPSPPTATTAARPSAALSAFASYDSSSDSD